MLGTPILELEFLEIIIEVDFDRHNKNKFYKNKNK